MQLSKRNVGRYNFDFKTELVDGNIMTSVRSRLLLRYSSGLPTVFFFHLLLQTLKCSKS